MNDTAIPTPTDDDWDAYDTWKACDDDAPTAAKKLGLPLAVFVQRMTVARTWMRVSGWREAFETAIRWGFSLADATDHADQKAAQTMREEA